MTTQSAFDNNRVTTASGALEGTYDPASGLTTFRGIPFAEPPVGPLRFAPPQAPKSWPGVRRAEKFGPRAMQPPRFADMIFRSDGMSEDCLYLNVWTPARSPDDRLPVLVYFYGGGNMGGDGSEPRYDGAALARRGIVTVTVNYRLGIFGFFAHPELSQEPPKGASGNQGYLDQRAGLLSVRDNIAAFGGDPARVTIAGESAGSFSVSIHMASPLTKDLIAGAIGSSGAAIATALSPVTLGEREETGAELAARLGASSLGALRAMPASQLLEATEGLNVLEFRPAVDGYLLPKFVDEIFAAGEQARVPLLVGWNSEESSYRGILGEAEPTPDNYAKGVEALYGELAGDVLRLYPAASTDEVITAATDLASDRFIGYCTWKWCDLHSTTGERAVYRYLYCHVRPPAVPGAFAGAASAAGRQAGAPAPGGPPSPRGAVHAADIDYALGNLETNPVYAWTADDFIVSETMQACYANFVKTGNPNGAGLPEWQEAKGSPLPVMHWDVESRTEPEHNRDRYLFHDRYFRMK